MKKCIFLILISFSLLLFGCEFGGNKQPSINDKYIEMGLDFTVENQTQAELLDYYNSIKKAETIKSDDHFVFDTIKALTNQYLKGKNTDEIIEANKKLIDEVILTWTMEYYIKRDIKKTVYSIFNLENVVCYGTYDGAVVLYCPSGYQANRMIFVKDVGICDNNQFELLVWKDCEFYLLSSKNHQAFVVNRQILNDDNAEMIKKIHLHWKYSRLDADYQLKSSIDFELTDYLNRQAKATYAHSNLRHIILEIDQIYSDNSSDLNKETIISNLKKKIDQTILYKDIETTFYDDLHNSEYNSDFASRLSTSNCYGIYNGSIVMFFDFNDGNEQTVNLTEEVQISYQSSFEILLWNNHEFYKIEGPEDMNAILNLHLLEASDIDHIVENHNSWLGDLHYDLIAMY